MDSYTAAMSTLMIIGATLFFSGGLAFMALLFGHGGWQRSRQFAVIGQLCSGAHGGLRRILTLGSLALIWLGAMACFAGVLSMDAERAERCSNHCIAAGYAEGVIGASLDRDPAIRFVACTCTAPDRPALELRADSR